MAAGSFLVENKVRPGCYIQIKGVPKASSVMSERGTVAILMNADSGDLVTEISANDILTGASAAKGFPLSEFTNENSILHYVYPYVNKIILGRLNAGGVKAQAVVLSSGSPAVAASGSGDVTGSGGGSTRTLVVTAKTAGSAGNSLSVELIKSGPTSSNVDISVKNNGSVVASGVAQSLVGASDGISILNNVADVSDYVVFSGDSPGSISSQSPVSISLSGGADAGGDPLLTAKANYDGTFGNGLSVVIVAEASGEGKYRGEGFFVRTSLNGEVVDEQNVKLPSELSDNDYLQFIKADSLSSLSAVAAVDLAGGTNGTESGTNLTGILSKLSGMPWNTLGYCGADTNRAVVSTFIKDLRENKGKYRQAVLFNSASEDYEGIISLYQGFVLDGEDPNGWDATKIHERCMWAVAFVAALTAGADVYVSNTYHVLPSNVASVIPPREEDAEVESGLRSGSLLFTHNSSGELVVEKDINTLHTYTQTRTPPFSKNRVIRTLDEISNTKVLVWETQFIGKIDNDDLGRALLKGQILRILGDFASIGAVARNDYDVTVEPGDDPDKVRSYEQLRPIDSMEQLYSYVTVLG